MRYFKFFLTSIVVAGGAYFAWVSFFSDVYVAYNINQVKRAKNERLSFKEGETFFMAISKTNDVDADRSEYTITGPAWLVDYVNGCDKGSQEYAVTIDWGDGSSAVTHLSQKDCAKKNTRIFAKSKTFHVVIEIARASKGGSINRKVDPSLGHQYIYIN